MTKHDQEINRRRFVGLLGAGVVGGVLVGPEAAAAAAQPIAHQAGDTVSRLLARIEQLEGHVASLSAALGHKPPRKDMGPVLNDYAGSVPTHTLDRRGDPLQYPIPLDSAVQWQRNDNGSPATGTSQILSLVHENTKATAFPWTLSSFLRTTHIQGEAAANFVRLQNYGGGWAAGFHAETYHRNGGATIGANIEAHSESTTGRVIGVNIQAVDWDITDQGAQTGPNATQLSEAINVQSAPQASWKTGLNFDVGSKGDRAIWVQGAWATGLDLGASHMVMNANSRIYLEETKQVYLTCNVAAGRIEFHWGDRVIGFIAYNAPEHAL